MDSDSSSHHLAAHIGLCLFRVVWFLVCNSGERDQLAAVVTRLAKKNYLPPDQPTLHEMVATTDVRLFNQVVAHVLAQLIPPSKSHSYNLRKCPHDLQIRSYQTNIRGIGPTFFLNFFSNFITVFKNPNNLSDMGGGGAKNIVPPLWFSLDKN